MVEVDGLYNSQRLVCLNWVLDYLLLLNYKIQLEPLRVKNLMVILPFLKRLSCHVSWLGDCRHGAAQAIWLSGWCSYTMLWTGRETKESYFMTRAAITSIYFEEEGHLRVRASVSLKSHFPSQHIITEIIFLEVISKHFS